MAMRGRFTAPGTSIHYFVVSFDPSTLKWEDFRGKVLGPTDPKDAPADSLRGIINAEWKELGLDDVPNVGNNGVHASASPFEGLAERVNWLQQSMSSDPFAKRLLEAGIPEATLKAWSVDPQVVLPDSSGKKGSLFDQVRHLALLDLHLSAAFPYPIALNRSGGGPRPRRVRRHPHKDLRRSASRPLVGREEAWVGAAVPCRPQAQAACARHVLDMRWTTHTR